MNRRFVNLLSAALFSFIPAASAQDDFVAPRVLAPARPAAPPPSSPTATRRTSTASETPCAHVTKGWADHRPRNDTPVAQGRASAGELFVALDACQDEQAAAPSDRRLAFLLARAFEVNGRGVQATPMFRQLSDGGFAPATTQLARAYAIGSGVARNQTAACDLYLRAAKAGDSWAFGPAADCLSFLDYPHDPRLACRYFQRAQASGTFQNTNLTREDYCP